MSPQTRPARDVEAEPALFRASGITKRFGAVTALNGVDLELRAGVGKSTLLKILGGDFPPDEGTMTLAGSPITFKDPQHAHSLGFRVVSQEPEIMQYVSVAENIFVGSIRSRGFLYNRHALEKAATAEIKRYGFDRVIGAQTLGSDLSPAQRQIVEIMRALISRPRVICFDEPTSSLGDDEVSALFTLIRSLRAEGIAIGYVSHRMQEIFELADSVTVFRDGKLVGSRRVSETTNDELVHMMVGRDLSQFFAREQHAPGELVLELDDATTDDVSDISMTVRAGEVVGVAGLVGAGRTELMKAIVGDRPLHGGTMKVAGKTVHFRSPADSVAAGIGFAPEERKAEALLMERAVRDNVVLAILPRLARALFVRTSREEEITQRYITQLNIRTPSSSQLVKNLSGGNQQKVVLARWLAREPKLLVLDEPTRGVDVGAKSEIYAIIDQLAQRGVAVLVVSSDLPEVIGLSDRIYVMAGGRITGELSRKEATEARILGLAMIEKTVASTHSSPRGIDNERKNS
jgi:ABC-type sugar transport system ATPase subunit